MILYKRYSYSKTLKIKLFMETVIKIHLFIEEYHLQIPLLLFFGFIVFWRIERTSNVKDVKPAEGDWKKVVPRKRFHKS
jgi:hypothetical protein